MGVILSRDVDRPAMLCLPKAYYTNYKSRKDGRRLIKPLSALHIHHVSKSCHPTGLCVCQRQRRFGGEYLLWIYFLSCLLTTLQDEWQLLDDSEDEESDQEVAIRIAKHDLVTAPIFTKGALEHLTTRVDNLSTQYGVLGKVVAIQ